MTINSGVAWKDLETKGFVHIRRFLSQPELAASRSDYAEQPMHAADPKYALSAATERGLGPVRHRVQEVLTAVSANTGLRVDHVLGAGYFSTK